MNQEGRNLANVLAVVDAYRGAHWLATDSKERAFPEGTLPTTYCTHSTPLWGLRVQYFELRQTLFLDFSSPFCPSYDTTFNNVFAYCRHAMPEYWISAGSSLKQLNVTMSCRTKPSSPKMKDWLLSRTPWSAPFSRLQVSPAYLYHWLLWVDWKNLEFERACAYHLYTVGFTTVSSSCLLYTSDAADES